MRDLEPYYFTFVGAQQLTKHTTDLLEHMDQQLFYLDIRVNFQLTSDYLTLISNYIKICELFGRISGRVEKLSSFIFVSIFLKVVSSYQIGKLYIHYMLPPLHFRPETRLKITPKSSVLLHLRKIPSNAFMNISGDAVWPH